MSAGVGKTYRMLQEAQTLLKNNIDVLIGCYIETHGRKETEELLKGLTSVPRKENLLQGKEFEEFDTDEIIRRHPEVVLVDELAHTNIPEAEMKKISGCRGINLQGNKCNKHGKHSAYRESEFSYRKITGIEIQERIPDSVIGLTR